MHVKANTTPASAPGGHVWEHEDDIVEVPDELGTDLLRIAGQFSEVLPTDPEHPDYVEPEPEVPGTDLDLGGDTEEPDLIGLPEPPRTGPQASKDAWRKYADSIGVSYPENASRDDLIKAVDNRNLIAE